MSVADAPRTPSHVPRHLPPHAPEVGWMRRFLGPFYVTGVFWFRLHRFGAWLIPSWMIGVLMPLFVPFFWAFLFKIRRAIAANLEAVLGPCGVVERQARIFRTIWSFSWCLTERYERLATRRRFRVEAEGLDVWRQVTGSGRGFVMVTAHIGAWEAGSMLPATEERLPIHVVREAETDPKAQEFIRGLIGRCAGDCYTTHFAEGEDPRLGMVLLEALRHGEVVALQGDRPRTGGRTREVELFGRPFPLPLGTAALARAAGVPLVPVFVFREGRRRYRCTIHAPIEVASTRDREADLTAALERFAAELEAAIRHQPHQWFCFRRVWGRADQVSAAT